MSAVKPAGTIHFAEVVELADALRSGRSGRKVVRVQIPPSAPKQNPHQKGISGGG